MNHLTILTILTSQLFGTLIKAVNFDVNKVERVEIHQYNLSKRKITLDNSIITDLAWTNTEKSDDANENLIKKYASYKVFFLDTIAGQLKTAQKLALLMKEKKYDEAILLFSTRQRKKIIALKKDPEEFKLWCWAWTFDKAKYERYTNRIKLGHGDFLFEENEWKIDEN